MLGGKGGVSSVFSVPPFQFQQLEQKNIHTVLSSFDVLGPHTFTVAWTSARFRKDNPELYAAFLDAVKEAPQSSPLIRVVPHKAGSTTAIQNCRWRW